MTKTMTEHEVNAVLADSRQERSVDTSMMTEALTALDDAPSAATMAAERARSLAEVLDAALAVLAEPGMPQATFPPFDHLESGAAMLSQ